MQKVAMQMKVLTVQLLVMRIQQLMFSSQQTKDHLFTEKLSLPYKSFMANISSYYEPTFFRQAVRFPEWKTVMSEELHAMESKKTRSVVALLEGNQAIDCNWFYRIKHKADGTINRYKARLVEKGFTQV
ncbi:hypothetical protein GQ457_14G012780 [Hibiscus cannabinus]